jgi:hypothetical protein
MSPEALAERMMFGESCKALDHLRVVTQGEFGLEPSLDRSSVELLEMRDLDSSFW